MVHAFADRSAEEAPGAGCKRSRRPALSAAEKLMAQREALGLLMRAEEAFRRCDPKYLEAVDNYAYLCLGESAVVVSSVCLSCVSVCVSFYLSVYRAGVYLLRCIRI